MFVTDREYSKLLDLYEALQVKCEDLEEENFRLKEEVEELNDELKSWAMEE